MATTSNLSKMVMQRKRLTRSFRCEVRGHCAQITAGIAERFAEEPETARASSAVELLLGLLDRSVERANDRLEQAENQHHRRLLEAKRLRRQRDQATANLYREMVEVRRAVAGLYGSEAVAEILGLEGRTARNATMLLEQAGLTITMLREWRPYPAEVGGTADPDDWLTKLEPPLEQLRTVFDEASPGMLRQDRTRDAKLRAISAFDDDFGPALRAICVFLELAGEESTASRLRRQLRRPHRFTHHPSYRSSAAPMKATRWLSGQWQRLRAHIRRI